jgi:hypothetical protein
MRAKLFTITLLVGLFMLTVPGQGFAIPIYQTGLEFSDAGSGSLMATVDVSVYEPGDYALYQSEIGMDLTLGASDYLYLYDVTNADPAQLIFAFVVYMDAGASPSVSQTGSQSGVSGNIDPATDTVGFYQMLYPGSSEVFYIASSSAPVVGSATFVSGTGMADPAASPAILVPDPPSPAVPEPGTLLLLGSGFVGLAAFRKRFSRTKH